MTLHEVFDLEDEMTSEIGGVNFRALQPSTAGAVKRSEVMVAIPAEQKTKVTSTRSIPSNRLNWIQLLIGKWQGGAWYRMPAFACALLFCVLVPLAVFMTGVSDGEISLEPAGGKSAGTNIQPKLELNIQDGKARFVDDRSKFSGTLASLPSAGSEDELFRLETTGNGAGGQSISIKGMLRLVRADAQKPIRTMSQIASGRFTGTIECVGKPPETVTWIYQTRP